MSSGVQSHENVHYRSNKREALDLFTATLVDAKRWREILDAVSTILDEAEFAVASNGMRLKSFDNSRTAMIDIELPSIFFDKFECEQPTRLRFNVKNILKLLENVGSNDSLQMSYSDEKAALVLSLTGDYLRVFNLNTLATEQSLEIEPKVNFAVQAKVLTSSLRKVILDSQKIGDQILIEAKEKDITFRTAGLGGNVVSTFASGESSILDLLVSQESKATYNLDLLGEIVKNAAPLSDKIKIEFSTDQPLKLDLLLPHSKLQYYMSPMLEIG